MENKNEQNKLTLLQEWCQVILLKEEWKKIKELASTSYIGANPKVRQTLAFFVKKEKVDINAVGNANTFSIYSKIKNITKSDWKKITSQIPNACKLYTQIKLNQNDINSNLKMQAYYLEKGMNKHFETIRNDNEQDIIHSPATNNYYGYYLTLLREMELWDTRKKDARQKIADLNELENAIDFFYHENKLRILVSRLNRASFQVGHAISPEQQKWVKNIPKSNKNIPQVKYYDMIYNMFAKEDDSIFNNLWNILESGNTAKELDLEYSYVLYLYLSAYCVYKTTRGHSHFHEKYINVNESLIDKGKLSELGYIPATKLKNIIKSGLECKGVDYAESILKEYRGEIPKTSNAMILEYCDALISFYDGNYLDAKSKLKPIAVINEHEAFEDQIKDNYIKIDVRYLYIITLIGLGLKEPGELVRFKKNFQEMLYSKKEEIVDEYIKSYKPGIRFIGKIIHVPPLERKYLFPEIIQEIKDEPYFRGKKWLISVLK